MKKLICFMFFMLIFYGWNIRAQSEIFIKSSIEPIVYIDSEYIPLYPNNGFYFPVSQGKHKVYFFYRHYAPQVKIFEVGLNEILYTDYAPKLTKKRYKFFKYPGTAPDSSIILFRSSKKRCKILIPEWRVYVEKYNDVLHFEDCDAERITFYAIFKNDTLCKSLTIKKNTLSLIYADFKTQRLCIVEQPTGDDQMQYISGKPYYFNYYENDTGELVLDTTFINSFKLGVHEVTCQRYCAFLNLMSCNINFAANGVKYYYPDFREDNIIIENGFFVAAKGKEKYPVNNIPEYGAEAYCYFYGFRLPCYEEWKYVASGGNLNYLFTEIDTLLPEDNPGTIINEIFGRDTLCPVGSLNPDKFGVYDILGNVWEIVTPSLKQYNQTTKTWTPLSLKKMQNGVYNLFYSVGGSYKSSPESLHYNFYNRIILRYIDTDMGFRVAKDTD